LIAGGIALYARRREQDAIDAPAIHIGDLEVVAAPGEGIAYLRDSSEARHDEPAERLIGAALFARQDVGSKHLAHYMDRQRAVEQYGAVGAPHNPLVSPLGGSEIALGIRRTANVMWDSTDDFEFRIFETPRDLEAAIRAKHAAGQSARLTAGFCWEWSNPTPTGHLVPDVNVGDWQMPWNAKSGEGRLAAGTAKEDFWASDPRGIEQVGCIYTAQGFEYDYAGVIWGLDLRYDPRSGQWIGDPSQSADQVVKRSREQFADLVKNTYRVLLTRGMKGCYVYFMDEDTRNFVRSRVE
jgi:DUF2075 family protein